MTNRMTNVAESFYRKPNDQATATPTPRKEINMLTKDQATLILEQAKAHKACQGNYDKAKEYLDKDDLVGFEEVCRGNYGWLIENNVAYKLTDGVATNWHDNGQRFTKSTYHNGERHGDYTEWYENGQMFTKSTYHNGKLHGDYTAWHKNGQACIKTTYLNGKQHGDYTAWYENGQIHIQTTYINGELHGDYTKRHKNGQISTQATYINGVEQEKQHDMTNRMTNVAESFYRKPNDREASQEWLKLNKENT